MHIEFNYRYYEDENQSKDYHLIMEECLDSAIAYHLDEVGEVVNFAENEQQKGRYVALYMTYEAAPYFNDKMSVNIIEENQILAVAYSFKDVRHKKENASASHNRKLNSTKQRHHFKFHESDDAMMRKIKLIQQAIVEGHTYQVNYTTRLYSAIHFPITALYDKLTAHQNGHYTALLDTPEIQVASISPELFFQKGDFKEHDNVILSKPMKGTMPRGRSIEEDEQLYYALKHSAKDRAENVMIVDLLRNDITRISQSGTINVDQPFMIECYDTVFQMTSMVSGQLKPQTNLVDIMRALFPCGSITGAPKLSTMKYIQQLETSPRSIYCGTIGVLLPDGRMIFNIPIRTIEYRNQEAIYGVGAGITIDSIPENEVQEFHDKTKILENL
ncbi:aminodeoxychorismate synthase component I [Staphylococcus caprae]|uniref:Para-aminobenzoate synthase component I n=1 Tax=Staphylococcus caprae TaxID=29380 RepID=A0ABN5W5B4_9STAP|nr:aminodeoxychorismate synthase component I [Staphylococcus caprae]EES41032.1 putative aminodeoxychorismate synthase, component I [Staphylococcus caprae M23864:W1]MBN6824888.1 aminodeoxychorismate synthase component I [Staphylococcus caprae]MDI0015022.1 aminodeoxychorismate synthase component I [Staphylococcus caprae]MEB8093750.1 aminodeoxychorismate synthase component I [Staphylococcus caprae]PAK64950.1 aminodeoxychorismate synthase, component I [Staphylococcus caprae]